MPRPGDGAATGRDRARDPVRATSPLAAAHPIRTAGPFGQRSAPNWQRRHDREQRRRTRPRRPPNDRGGLRANSQTDIARSPAESRTPQQASALSVPATSIQRVKADGVNVFYRTAGDPDSPVVVLLHGFPASSFMFRELIPRLADDYRVIAPGGSCSEPLHSARRRALRRVTYSLPLRLTSFGLD